MSPAEIQSLSKLLISTDVQNRPVRFRAIERNILGSIIHFQKERAIDFLEEKEQISLNLFCVTAVI